MIPGEKITMDNLNHLIEHHMAFLIRTVSNFTGRYVSVENDDEFSIALSAFAEAVERYDEKRGQFLGFAKLVIESRLKNYAVQKKKEAQTVSLEALQEEGRDFVREKEDNDGETLHEEIVLYREELLKFNLTLEILADCAPKHKDTRRVALDTAETASRDEDIVSETYEKRRLPIRRVSKLAGVTEKIVKGSRHFILAAMIIFIKKFPSLLYWIKGTRCDHVS